MTCHLLGIATQAELDRSPFLGALFEGVVAGEILKSQIIYYFRDQQGLEVDFLFPGSVLRRSMGEKMPVRVHVVHRPSRTGPLTRTLSPGIEALEVGAFVDELNGKKARDRRTRELGSRARPRRDSCRQSSAYARDSQRGARGAFRQPRLKVTVRIVRRGSTFVDLDDLAKASSHTVTEVDLPVARRRQVSTNQQYESNRTAEKYPDHMRDSFVRETIYTDEYRAQNL
ncbi:MAG: DUF4143 domain-containing protein [Acidobacteria bacterium]|nr:DUF4143 domain-containing protein [Acidobacteriota bacterium]